MADLVLHIGLPKTATSYIQRWLVTNAKALRRRRLWVPPRQILAHRIAVEAIVNPAIRNRDDVKGIMATPLEGIKAALAEAVSHERFRQLLVSSEYFFEAEPQAVYDLMSGYASGTIKIVILLRRQDRLVESGYNQSVKAMGFTVPVMTPRYLPNLDWFELIRSWAAVFGGENITVLNYDQLALQGEILPGFLDAVDPEVARLCETDEFTPVPSVNESLPADLLEFKRIANSWGEFGLDRWLYRMMEAGHQGPAFRIPEETARQIIALYQASNDRVAREILGSDKPLFPDYGGPGERAGEDLYGQLPVETLAKIVAFSMKEANETIAELRAEIARLRALVAPGGAGSDTVGEA